jgi:hypothetical protein
MYMRVRHLISTPKNLLTDTSWRTTDLPVKFAPVYKKAKPMKGGWTWRSAELVCKNQRYILTAQCLPAKDNWQSWLMTSSLDGGASIVARFENHGSHPGVHVHSRCETSGILEGGASIDNLNRFPDASSVHRRDVTFTKETFWDQSLKFFRVRGVTGTLI